MTNTNPFQKTLKETLSIEGVGLHTGKSVSLSIMPASENHGFKFRRTDLLQSPIIEVFAENSETVMCNSCRKHNVKDKLVKKCTNCDSKLI